MTGTLLFLTRSSKSFGSCIVNESDEINRAITGLIRRRAAREIIHCIFDVYQK